MTSRALHGSPTVDLDAMVARLHLQPHPESAVGCSTAPGFTAAGFELAPAGGKPVGGDPARRAST